MSEWTDGYRRGLLEAMRHVRTQNAYAVDAAFMRDFACWCLGRNLAIAGALMAAGRCAHPRTAYSCASCSRDFCFVCDASMPDAQQVKTIGSRYCDGCVDAEAEAHGLPISVVRSMRAKGWRLRTSEP